MDKLVVLTILDGWGIGARDVSNPLWQAKLPTFDHIKRNYPATALQAAGIGVGLPWGEEGNSEVGHLTLGAGKVLYQHLPRITLSIRDGSFFKNPALAGAVEHVKAHNSTLHVIGLLSSAQVHSAYNHLEGLIDLAKMNSVQKLKIHPICDGRDSGPREEPRTIEKLDAKIKAAGVGEIASLCGRFYAMDRDHHWERTRKAYELYTEGTGRVYANPYTALNEVYQRGLSDEFVEPIVISPSGDAKANTIRDNDAVIFFDYREDSARQLASSFCPEFDQFPRRLPQNLFVATFTRYDKKMTCRVAFEPLEVTHPLSRVISDNGLRQLHIAETEKYAHVTYFFNGGVENPYPGEYRILVPSLSVPRFDEHPELSAPEITTRLIGAIEEGIYNFIIVNFANGDLVAHTGNIDAAVKAAEVVDDCLRQVMESTSKHQAYLLITSDHGNVECMMDPKTGEVKTGHDPSPVPFYLIANEFFRPKSDDEVIRAEEAIGGLLSDVAPTILALLGVPKPADMTGHNLLPILGFGNYQAK